MILTLCILVAVLLVAVVTLFVTVGTGIEFAANQKEQNETVMKELDDLNAQVERLKADQTTILNAISDLRSQIATLKTNAVDPAAVEAAAQSMSATLDSLEAGLTPPAAS